MVTYTTTMYKVTQVATGVAGAPYYLSAYFGASAGTAQAAASAWRAFLSMGPSTYSAGLVFNAITDVQEVDPVTGDLTGLATVTVAAQTFTGAGEPLPAATSGLMRWRTQEYIGGRELRGRTNIPRLAENDSTNGVPAPTLVTDWNARAATLLGAAGVLHAVWSPKNGVWAETVAATMWGQWAVLRSRRD